MYNAKSAAASLRGAQNRAEGALFEELIEKSCKYYADKGIAYIEKTPEPFKVTKALGKGQFQGHFTKQAQPDFKGTVCIMVPGRCDYYGRSMVFDAKATSTDRIPTSVLSDEQRESLLLHKRLGALSGVLMSFSFQKFYCLPIDVFLKAKEYNGHLYWTAAEIEKMFNPVSFTGGILRLFTE